MNFVRAGGSHAGPIRKRSVWTIGPGNEAVQVAPCAVDTITTLSFTFKCPESRQEVIHILCIIQLPYILSVGGLSDADNIILLVLVCHTQDYS